MRCRPGCRPRGLYNHLRAFKAFKRNSANEITRADFTYRLRHQLALTKAILSTADINDVFDTLDADGNGARRDIDRHPTATVRSERLGARQAP